MTRDEDGKPLVAPTARALGVRVPPNPNPDIQPDEDGNVHPDTGGMSVAPNWRDLQYHRIPRRLRPLFPDARGKDEDYCWRLGEDDFTDGGVADGLYFRVDSDTHGTLQPVSIVSLEQYQQALAATRDAWVIDET